MDFGVIAYGAGYRVTCRVAADTPVLGRRRTLELLRAIAKTGGQFFDRPSAGLLLLLELVDRPSDRLLDGHLMAGSRHDVDGPLGSGHSAGADYLHTRSNHATGCVARRREVFAGIGDQYVLLRWQSRYTTHQLSGFDRLCSGARIRSGQNDRERASEARDFRIQRADCNHCYRTGYRCDVSIFRERRAPPGTRFGCPIAGLRSGAEGSALTRSRGVVAPRRMLTNRSPTDKGVKYEHYPNSY